MADSRAATWVESCGQVGSFGMKLGLLLDDLPLFGTGFVGFRSKPNSTAHCFLFSSLIVCALFVCTIFFFFIESDFYVVSLYLIWIKLDIIND